MRQLTQTVGRIERILTPNDGVTVGLAESHRDLQQEVARLKARETKRLRLVGAAAGLSFSALIVAGWDTLKHKLGWQ